MALAANALTDVATYKIVTGIPAPDTSQDARIELYINVGSDLIEKHTKRKLLTQTHTQEYSGRRENELLLDEYPITGGPATGGKPQVFIDSDWVFGSESEVNVTEYDVFEGIKLIRKMGEAWPNGFRNIRVTYEAGLGIIGTLPAALVDACTEYTLWRQVMFQDRRIGRTSKSKQGETVTYVQRLPEHIEHMLEQYERFEMPRGHSQLRNG